MFKIFHFGPISCFMSWEIKRIVIRDMTISKIQHVTNSYKMSLLQPLANGYVHYYKKR